MNSIFSLKNFKITGLVFAGIVLLIFYFGFLSSPPLAGENEQEEEVGVENELEVIEEEEEEEEEVVERELELFNLYGEPERKTTPDNPFIPWYSPPAPPTPTPTPTPPREERVEERVEEKKPEEEVQTVFPPTYQLKGVAGSAEERLALLFKDGRGRIVELGEFVDRWQVIEIRKNEIIMLDTEFGQEYLLRLGGEESEMLP